MLPISSRFELFSPKYRVSTNKTIQERSAPLATIERRRRRHVHKGLQRTPSVTAIVSGRFQRLWRERCHAVRTVNFLRAKSSRIARCFDAEQRRAFSLDQTNRTLQKSIDALQQSTKSASNEIDELERQLDDARRKFERDDKECAALQAKFDAATEDLLDTQSALSSCRYHLNIEAISVLNLEAKVGRYRERLVDEQSRHDVKIARKNNEIRRLSDKIQSTVYDYQNALEETEDYAETLRVRPEPLEIKNETLNAQYEDAKTATAAWSACLSRSWAGWTT